MTPNPQTHFPPISQLIPHAGPMILLDRVLEHSPERTICERTIRSDDIFLRLPQGDVPAWIGIECMAQCIAAHARLLVRDVPHDTLPQRGFLVGARQVNFNTPSFHLGQCLQISAKPASCVLNFLSFDCEVRDDATGALQVAGQIHIFVEQNTNHGEANHLTKLKE